MELSHIEQQKTQKIRDRILADENYISNFRKCKHCSGTGLAGIHHNEGTVGFSWDSMSFCNKCKGIGFTQYSNSELDWFICSKCKGAGKVMHDTKKYNKKYQIYDTCDNCKGSGMISWIDKMKGR